MKDFRNEIGKYEWVLDVIKSYEEEDILNDFKNEFKEGEDINWSDYCEFCSKYIDDMSEGYYIRKNWEYIIGEGDVSVFDNDDSDSYWFGDDEDEWLDDEE